MLRYVVAAVAVALCVPAGALAASPEPSATAAAAGPIEEIVSASVDIARLLVNVGLVLVVVSFIVMIATLLVTTPELKKVLEQLVAQWRNQPRPLVEADGTPAFPYSDLLRAMFGTIPDLIRTPVGVGMALVLLAVFLLLGQGAISSGFTEAAVPAPTPAPSTAPSAGPSTEPSVAAPASQGAPGSVAPAASP